MKAILFLFLFLPVTGHALTNCLYEENRCNPDKLCTFKYMLAMAQSTLDLYLKNDGGGRLYNESINEARRKFPNLPRDKQMQQAAQILNHKIEDKLLETFTIPACPSGGTIIEKYLPKPGYAGMSTVRQGCRIRVDYQDGDYNPEGFGASDATCKEFYERDYAHELVHKKTCDDAKEKGTSERVMEIDQFVKDEIAAYRLTVKLSKAHLSILSLQCSSKAKPGEILKRGSTLIELLGRYQVPNLGR